MAAIGNPAMLTALALVAVPILLHILARRRYATVKWAATDLLRRAEKRLRQRVEVKDLLLLALRVGAVALAVLAASGILVSSEGPLGSFARQDREVVLAFDCSPSMAATAAGVSRLTRAVRRADELLASLDATDRVTICTFDSALHPLGRALPPEGARVCLESVTPGPVADRPAEPLRRLAAELVARPGAKQVFVFSHFPAIGWPAEIAPVLTRKTARGDPIEWHAVRTGTADTGNLRVVEIVCRPPRPRVAESCEIRIRLENTDATATGRRVLRTTIADREIDVRSVELGPGETAAVSIAARIDALGPVDLACRLDPDALSIDDAAFAVVCVAPPATVALVEPPNAERRPYEGPLDYVRTALTAAFDGDSTAEGDSAGESDDGVLAIERITPEHLGRPRLAIISPDVALTDALAGRLERVRRAGGTVLAIAGPRTTDTARGFGLDGPIVAWPDGRRLVLTEDGARHDALRFLRDTGPAHLARARVFKACVPTALPEDATVLIAAGHEKGPPLLIERRGIGRDGTGRLLWWASSLTPDWTDLPTPAAGNQVFVPLLLELVRTATATAPDAPQLFPGESFARPDVGRGADDTVPPVLGPDGLPVEPGAAGESVRATTPGIYRWGTADRATLAAVNPAPSESRSDDLDHDSIADRFPNGDVVEPRADLRAAPPLGKGALDRLLLALAGAFLVAEMLLAWAFGRGRR